MKFNAMSQCRFSCDGFSFPQQQQQSSATQIMYPSGSFPTQTPSNQASAPLQSHHAYQGRSINGISKASPMQHCNTFIGDARSQPPSVCSSEPPDMTAQTIGNLGMQNSRMLLQPSMESKTWNQKTFDGVDFTTLEADVAELGQGLINTDDSAPIIELCQSNSFDPDNIQDAYCNDLPRRMSESSFSMSSNGLMAEVPTLEDFATSDLPYVSDCDWTHLEPTKPVISPIPSPGPPHHDAIRNGGGRSRASPIQHNTMRTSPYTLESDRAKRWSTGTYASNSPQMHPMHQFNNGCSFYGSPLNPQHSLPPATAELPSNFHNQVQNLLYSQPTLQTPSATVLSSPDQHFTATASRPMHSQGLFRLLQSNADRLGGYSSHFVELSSPPDLYVSLHDEPSNPPESDMNTSDPNLVPHEQDLRFTGDLYTPRWVRGHGNKREGWCGLCKPGRWLVLKNSAFWYDKSFTHGVSAATGSAFQGPQDTRRTEGNLDVWEGLCGSCGDWIPLVSSKKKGTTWFRHAYKCHTHPKIKDGPKRRRETSSSLRARSVAPTFGSATATSSLPVRQSPVETISSIESASNSTESGKTDDTTSSVSTAPQLSQTPLSTPQMNAISNLPNGLGQQSLEQHQKIYHDASTTFLSENSLPGLTGDADGVKMINPFESFTVVI